MKQFSNQFYPKLTETITKLDYSWFLNRQQAFKNEEFYDQSKGLICIIRLSKYPINELVGEFNVPMIVGYNSVEIHETMDFLEYCQAYPPINEESDFGNSKIIKAFTYTPYNIIDVANELQELIQPLIASLNSQEISKFISNLGVLLNDEIDNLKSTQVSDKAYESVLNEFLKHFNTIILKKYETELVSNQILLQENSEKLHFNLSQEELVSLLYILAEANILKVESVYDKDKFLPFCFRHFTFIKNNNSVSLTNLKTLENTYLKKFRGEGGAGLGKIKEKLLRVLLQKD